MAIPLKIRFARSDDHMKVVELGEEVFTPYGEYRETIDRWLNTPGVRCLVARRDQVFCGAIIFAFFVEDDHYYGEILAIEVAREQRRTGVGRAMLAEVIGQAEDLARVYRIDSIRLSTADTNHGAQALFSDLEFRPTGGNAGYYDGGQKIVRMAHVLPVPQQVQP